ncbi:CIP1 ligase, partial [Amia calva]|nr:CIP1 ligase [Amia calva]
MSLCEDTLLCNFPKCRGKLSGFAWVTACSHVFCDQVHQERLYQEFAMSRAEGHVRQVEKLLSQQSQSRELELSAMREEVNCLKKMLEEYKRKYSEVSERLMERNRQYQKLQGMYDSLRLRSMVGEREASQGTEYSAGQHSLTHTDTHCDTLWHSEGNAATPIGTVRYHTPRQSPGQAGMEGDSRGHHSFLSALENDSGKTGFFQFISPVRHSQAYKGPPRVFTKTH